MYYGSFGDCLKMVSAGTFLLIAAVVVTVAALVMKNASVMKKLGRKKAE